MRRTAALILMGAGVFGCNDSAQQTSPALVTQPAEASTSLKFYEAGIVGTWGNTQNNDHLVIDGNGSIYSTSCNSQGSITEISPSERCFAEVSACGTATIAISVSNGVPGCLPAGSATCAYMITNTTLYLNCGDRDLTYTYGGMPAPPPSPSPGSQPSPSPSTAPSISPSTSPSASPSASPSPTPSPSPSASPSTSPLPTGPAISYDFSITGAAGTKPTYTTLAVATDDLLKVRVYAGPAGQVSISGGTYSNFTATYGCVQYKVEALGAVRTTRVLSTGQAMSSIMCPDAPTYDEIDFSDRLNAGHNSLEIKVTGAYYDFYCQMVYYGYISYAYYYNYCPMYSVYKTHTVTGTLKIQVNGTAF